MMLSIQDLDGFLDRLGDLQREGDPLELAIEATGLLTDSPAQRFLMQRRAAFAADAHLLDGVTITAIATACGKTTQTVRLWLQEYGPRHYLTIGLEHDASKFSSAARLVLRRIPVDNDDKIMRRRIRDQRADGRCIVPARRNLIDDSQPDGYVPGIDVTALWKELGG